VANHRGGGGPHGGGEEGPGKGAGQLRHQGGGKGPAGGGEAGRKRAGSAGGLSSQMFPSPGWFSLGHRLRLLQRGVQGGLSGGHGRGQSPKYFAIRPARSRAVPRPDHIFFPASPTLPRLTHNGASCVSRGCLIGTS